MPLHDARSIAQMDAARFREPAHVDAVLHDVVRLEDAGTRRAALAALVAQLLAVGELEPAVHAARLTPSLTPVRFVNDVEPMLTAELLLDVVDRHLMQGRNARALQLLDEAALCLQDLGTCERYDIGTEPIWLRLTRAYASAGAHDRIADVWDRVLAWAQRLEQSDYTPEPVLLQPDDGSRFVAGVAEDMARHGEPVRARELAASIRVESTRTEAMARVAALTPGA